MRRTAAMASEKVGSTFGYHAAPREVRELCAAMSFAHRVTREKRPSRAGVVRRMASRPAAVLDRTDLRVRGL